MVNVEGKEGKIKRFERMAVEPLIWVEKTLLNPKPLWYFALCSRNICVLLVYIQYCKDLQEKLDVQQSVLRNHIENMSLDDDGSSCISALYDMVFFSLWVNNLLQSGLSIWKL